MESITVAAFYSGTEHLDEYIPFIKASRVALQITNPRARYVILTDPITAPLVAPHADVAVVADPELPLMIRIVAAQQKFSSIFTGDLLVLPDVDCLANQDISSATPDHVRLAITHKGLKFQYRINNLAYIRDGEHGAWFLGRALEILKSWPREQWDWWGDQDAWGAALGSRINGLGAWVLVKEYGGDLLVAEPERGRKIHVYPCQTHNCTMPDDGKARQAQRDAFFVHFKGPRKSHIDAWMNERFKATI